MTIHDDDNEAGIFVDGPGDGTAIAEDGGSLGFDVYLLQLPTAVVTVDVATNDSSNSMTDKSLLYFGPGNWSDPQV